ncbi:MAG: PilZ domain-containing protein [Deltaproteobacteria bacterium]|nr:PilZ domain-containing protein [Deltaproteobacteria bacterium]
MPRDRRKRKNRAAARATAEGTASERRRGERRSLRRITVELWVRQEYEREICLCRAADLSVGGMQFDYGLPHPVGTQVELRFALPGVEQRIEVSAEIIAASWTGRTPTTNLRFLDLSDENRRHLRAFLATQAG